MIDNIQLLTSMSNLSMGNSQDCKCDSNKGAFDIAMISLLNAVAERNTTNNNEYINNGLETGNKDNTLQEVLQNTLNNTNRIESTSKDKDVNKQIDEATSIASKKYGVDENLIRAIIKVESNFNPNVVSSAGAKGLMQLMPENIKHYGVKDPFNIQENIDAGTRHIKDYIDMYDGNVEMGLMAYNGGPTRMRNRGVTSVEHIYKMPKETQNYVPKVMKYYKG